MLLSDQSSLLFNRITKVMYEVNKPSKSGGVIYSQGKCNITFDKNSNVTFSNNTAKFLIM